MPTEITKDMIITEVLNIHRGTARIFMQFGMTCLGCPHATGESIEAACEVHGTDPDELVRHLNVFLANAQ